MSAVIVVGAGIVGASVAYHLARGGVPVTVLERASAPATGVTGDSFAWIGEFSGDWPGGTQDLRPHVRADFHRLESELPGFAVRWSGSLEWNGVPGPGQVLVGPDEIAVLEPRLLNPPARAVHTPTDGGVDPVAMTDALIRGARAHGAEVFYGAAAVSVNPPEGRGVMTSAGFYPAETVVLAAGVGSAALCRPLNVEIPFLDAPACLLRATASPGLIKTILSGPDFEAREVRDGELVLTMPYTESPAQDARETLRRLASGLDDGDSCQLVSYHVCRRPMPANGPIVGHVTSDRSVYVAVAHSAITLAPTLGRLIAAELTSGNPAGELRRCRMT